MHFTYEVVFICFWFTGIITLCAANITEYVKTFKAFSVATNETDGFKQFIRSAKIYNVPVEVIGFGKKWAGGDMRGQGGGFKVNLVKEALKSCKDNKDQIIMFTDSYDVLFLSDVSNIIKKFLSFDARIVFSAELWIWPDSSLTNEFPEVKNGYRFLNSGGFIGFCDSVNTMLNSGESIEDIDDDQLFYSKIYVDVQTRSSLNIKLDHRAEIFQNLFGAIDDVHLLNVGNKYELSNIKFNTKPCVLHGNGLSKYVDFRTLGNYLAERWVTDKGCKECEENVIKLEGLSMKDYPKVVIAIFINKPTPFFKEFLEKVFRQNYPKKKIFLFVHNAVQYHRIELEALLSQYEKKYAGIKLLQDSDDMDTISARYLAFNYCIQKECDFYLNVDSDAHLDNEETLVSLIQQNRSVVAPLLTRPYKAWSNFWGALSKQGYYKRSFDYMDIVSFRRKGLWNVPYISSCYLINATVLRNPDLKPVYIDEDLDFDMSFCSDMRKKGVYLYVNNLQEFGHLTDLEGFDTSKTNPNVYELMRNRKDWEHAYLHSEYMGNFSPNRTHLQPCPDVYWFPIVSPRFCREFIEIMEAFGQWSDGSNQDSRLQGGYEAVPTRDIHMTQVGLNEQWLEFLRLYVTPLQEMIFIGYHHNPPKSLMNFVVRYKPDEQPSLKPHHDSSTYTINIALNNPHIDYEGGGCRFLRYNCAVTNMKLGWMLMHPGRLTHFHEGLLVTKGTRYIMVSFVDP